MKRLCLASLSMAGWLLGMTIIGFLIAVVGPIGAAAVEFYSDLDLDCEDSVRKERARAPTRPVAARKQPSCFFCDIVNLVSWLLECSPLHATLLRKTSLLLNRARSLHRQIIRRVCLLSNSPFAR